MVISGSVTSWPASSTTTFAPPCASLPAMTPPPAPEPTTTTSASSSSSLPSGTIGVHRHRLRRLESRGGPAKPSAAHVGLMPVSGSGAP